DALLKGGVPGVLRVRGGEVDWHTAQDVYRLPHDTRLIRGPEPLRQEIAHDLATLARNRFAGDLVALGWHPARMPLTFADENGSHAGPSPEEVLGFLLLPPASRHLVAGEFLRGSTLRRAVRAHLGRAPRNSPIVFRRVEEAPARGRIRVVSYNVHYCRGLDGRFAPERIARVLQDLNPDIVAVQELDSGRSRSRREDQLGYLAEKLGMH